MFCFRVESDVAQRLLAAGLGDHLAVGLQTTIMSRLREVYLGIVAEEVEQAGRPDTDAFAASAEGPSHGARFADYRNDHDLDAGAERAYVRRGPDGVVERATFQAWASRGSNAAVRAVDVTIRLAVTSAGDGSEERELRRRVDQAVSDYLRSAGEALLLPDMSSLLITVEHVGKNDEAHLRVAAAAAGDGVRGLSWAHDAEPRDLAEALAAQLGLRAAGPFGPKLALLGPAHIDLLRALAVDPKDIRDRLGWIRTDSEPARDDSHLAAAAVVSPVAEYGAPPDLSLLHEEPVAYQRERDGALTKDQGQRFDKNQPTDDWPSLKVAGKWTVRHVTRPRTGREWKALAQQVTKLMQQPYDDGYMGVTRGWVRGWADVKVPGPAAEWALGLAVATGAVPDPVGEAKAAASVLSQMFDRVWNTLDQVELDLRRDQVAEAVWDYIGARGDRRWPAGAGTEATALRLLQEFLTGRVVNTLRQDYPLDFGDLDDRAVLPLVEQAVAGLEQAPPREVVENVTAAFMELYATDRIDLPAPQAQAGLARLAITRDPITGRGSRLSAEKRDSATVLDVSFDLTLTGSVGGVTALPVAWTLATASIDELAARMVATFRQPYGGKNPPKWSTVAVEVPKGVAPESVAGVTQAVWKAAGLLDHGIYVKLYGWTAPLRICP